MDKVVPRKQATRPQGLSVAMQEHRGEAISPDLAVVTPTQADDPPLPIHADPRHAPSPQSTGNPANAL
jgi:hypothetical protein